MTRPVGFTPTFAPTENTISKNAVQHSKEFAPPHHSLGVGAMVQSSLERLVSHILEHGQRFGSGHRLTVNLPVRTTAGTIIPTVFDRFNLDTEHGPVWVHSSTARTTYAATEIDAAFWNHRLEVRL